MIDQERYTINILKRYCTDMPFGTPAFHDTPAPTNYMYSFKNKTTDKDKAEIKKLYVSLDF